MILGFTGTRRGLAGPQYTELCRVVREIGDQDIITEARHGDCVGADAEFHDIIRSEGRHIRIVGHPPVDSWFRANCECDELRTPKPYLVRNADIVAESDRIIATPHEMTEQQRGGTWSTIRKARKAGKSVTIVYPDGSVTG